ncbi:MAG: hypothetical protein JNJ86_11175, partial [Chitinophagaceae bacterium]|nr:hypothetical protein [Chitinophagaceae bacterium]
KCCLNYELDTYLDALQHFPDNCDMIQVAKGNAFLIKKDIFKNLMWYTLPDSNKQYPLTIEGVIKIKAQNRQGIIPEELEVVDVTTNKPKEVEPEFVDVVGQISLRTLEKADKKKRQQQQQQRQQGQQGQRPQQRQAGNQQRQQGQNPNQGNRPNQQRGQQGGGQQGGQQQNRPPRRDNRPPNKPDNK